MGEDKRTHSPEEGAKGSQKDTNDGVEERERGSIHRWVLRKREAREVFGNLGRQTLLLSFQVIYKSDNKGV